MRVIALGFECNNACVFCAQGELRHAPAPNGGADRIRNELATIQANETVVFVGGEPTLHHELPAWIADADRRGARRIVIQTNGRRLVYRAYARELASASSRLALDVSLHGSTAAMHDYHTSVAGSFQQTVKGLVHARAERIDAGVSTVITRSNYRHLGEIVRLVHSLGVRALHLSPSLPHGRARTQASRILPPAELVAPHVAEARREARRLGVEIAIARASDRLSNGELLADRFFGIGPFEPDPDCTHPIAAATNCPERQLAEEWGT